MNLKLTRAIKSICPSDGKHIIIWDFDNIMLKKVLKSLSEVQNTYTLSNIYVISSRNGYNAVCFDKLDLDVVYEIKCNTRYDDYYHQLYGYELNGWCLRVDRDKKHIMTIPSDNLNMGSYAHKEFFRLLLGINSEGFFDTSELLCINYYRC